MCGFKGFAFWSQVNEFPLSYSRLMYKSSELSKRGPDDRNIACQFPLILDHYRLSIRGVDMQESIQPKENSNYFFAFNGEIYAHSSESLQKKGVRSDTEFLWEKLNAEGPTNFLQDLSGEFSVIIYDKNNSLLFLSVDYFGVKPLYYSVCDLGVSFSSSLKDCYRNISLISNGSDISPIVDQSQLGEYLLFRTFSGKNTGYIGVHKILPGEMQVFNLKSQEQSLLRISYEQTSILSCGIPSNLDNYVDLMLSLLQSYAQSDLPVSVCLSGGIDSTMVLYGLIKNNLLPTCFNVSQGYSDPDFKACQDILEDMPGLTCKFIDVSNQNPWNPVNYQAVHDRFDGWVHLPNAVYLDKLFEQAAARFKVILSGEGADELLGSYNRYTALPHMLAGKYSSEARSSYSEFKNWPSESLGLANEIALTSSFSSREFALLACNHLNLKNGLTSRSNYLVSKTRNHFIQSTPLAISEMMQENDINYYLPSMLRRQDILSMNYSIECRVPLASLEFMHLCKSAKRLPNYTNSFGTKGIARDIAERLNVPG